jgi:hypothetical protein
VNEGFTALTQLGQTFVIPCWLERDCLVKEVICCMLDFGVFAANWGGAHGVQKGIRREGRRKGGEGGRLATTEIGSLAQQLAGFSALFLKLGEGRWIKGRRGRRCGG